MATTFSLAPIPIWYLADQNGQPAGGCIMYPRSSLNNSLVKPVFQDPGGTIPWPVDQNGGIVFNSNASQGPFYWENTGITGDYYHLEFFNQNGDLLFTIDPYPITSGGGGPPVTVMQDLTNQIIDGQFSYNLISAPPFGSNFLPLGPVSPIPVGDTSIMPIVSLNNPATQGGWFFNTDITGSTSTLDFPAFTLGATSPDSNPRYMAQYSCTVSGTGTTNDLIFRTLDVKSFSNQTIAFSFQANSISAPIGVMGEIVIRQYFGTGGSPSPTVEKTFSFVFPTSFTLVPQVIAVPSVAGLSRGTNNDDRFEIGVRFPISSTGVYQVTNFSQIFGSIVPTVYIYENQVSTYYKVSSYFYQRAVFRTGDTVDSWDGSARLGWLTLIDGNTIGNAGSGATYQQGSIPGGFPIFPLYQVWWNISAIVVVGGRGVSASADFSANKVIIMPPTGQRVAANANNSLTLPNNAAGTVFGEVNHTLTIPEMPSHTHNVTLSASSTSLILVNAGSQVSVPQAVPTTYTSTFTGGGSPHNNIQPSYWLYRFVKL